MAIGRCCARGLKGFFAQDARGLSSAFDSKRWALLVKMANSAGPVAGKDTIQTRPNMMKVSFEDIVAPDLAFCQVLIFRELFHKGAGARG